MRRKKILLPLILGIFVFSSVFALQAQEEKKTFTGSVLLGYRAVDTSGAFTRYKQDFNLDDGVRLFNLNMHFTPKNSLKKLFDRLGARAEINHIVIRHVLQCRYICGSC